MDFNLIISAQRLQLAADLQTTPPDGRLIVVKNVPARTYLRVTPEQWFILRQFQTARSVPAVLEAAIRDRFGVPLGEFYELILKAVRAHVLLTPGAQPPAIKAANWTWRLRPAALNWPLQFLFLTGMALALAFRPELPSSALGVAAGVVILSGAFSLAAFVVGCGIFGGGGEVYHARWSWAALPPRFRLDAGDAVLLPRSDRKTLALVEPAFLAAAAGLTMWHQPDWGLIPLLGLMVALRPVLGGPFVELLRPARDDTAHDAARDFLFPPNRGPRARGRALGRAVRRAHTWITVGYGVVWTLAVVYLAARFTDTPPWTIEFWQANGGRVAVAIGLSLALLAAGYLLWESYGIVRDRLRDWRRAAREAWRRWVGAGGIPLDETGRLEVISNSPLLRTLSPPQRQQLVPAFEVVRHGPWRNLKDYRGAEASHVAVIVSGRVGLHRQLPSGRKVRTQTLEPGDVLGLHENADPTGGRFELRTRTPVTLLRVPRAVADEIFVRRLPAPTLTNLVLKLPFLRAIPLCRHWHMQAIERFALLSNLFAYADGEVVLNEEVYLGRFFIIFEGDVVVSRQGQRLAVVEAGEFFGEIGMMQNSLASATITARRNLRCLAIPRQEFMRFVTHNYSVALEIERVCSQRLGRPLFPLRPGGFTPA
jgi:CRP-like cAMP-binding protein